MRVGFRLEDAAPWFCCRTGTPMQSPTFRLCRKLLNMLGIAVLRLTMPYHDIRMPAEISRADYAVSANIGRTLDAVRQGVVDIRCCFDWLEQQGYNELGTSAGRDCAPGMSFSRQVASVLTRLQVGMTTESCMLIV